MSEWGSFGVLPQTRLTLRYRYHYLFVL